MIIYDYFSSVFCVAPKRVLLLQYRKWASHLKNHYHYAKVVENARINFAMSPYCSLLFSRKEIFWSSFVGCSLQWRSWLHCECVRISALKFCQYQAGHLLAFKNGHKSTQTRCKVCSDLTMCTATIDFHLTSVFFINLEYLSHPTLVLLFILWKGKCWLKVRWELFVKIIEWC